MLYFLETVETAASAFSKAATTIRNGGNLHHDVHYFKNNNDKTKFRGRPSVFIRHDRKTALQEIMERNVASWVYDTLYTEARKNMDDEETVLHIASMLQGISSNMNDIRKVIEKKNEEDLKKTFEDPGSIFDPKNSFYHLSRQSVVATPIYRRSSSKQKEMLQRLSVIKFENGANELWQDAENLLEDFPSDSEDEKGKKVASCSGRPIISKEGSEWMLDERAIR